LKIKGSFDFENATRLSLSEPRIRGNQIALAEQKLFRKRTTPNH